MSKTPYEIRLEILKLANEILTTPVHQKRDAMMQQFYAEKEFNEKLSAPQRTQFPTLPDFPSTSEVMAKAAELRAFVDQQ
jgi:hypothetical protein